MAHDPPAADSAVARVRAALRLRAGVLRALAGEPGGLAAGPPDAWALLLASERCARPLARTLEASGGIGILPEKTASVARRRLEIEARRVLAGWVRLVAVADAAEPFARGLEERGYRRGPCHTEKRRRITKIRRGAGRRTARTSEADPPGAGPRTR